MAMTLCRVHLSKSVLSRVSDDHAYPGVPEDDKSVSRIYIYIYMYLLCVLCVCVRVRVCVYIYIYVCVVCVCVRATCRKVGTLKVTCFKFAYIRFNGATASMIFLAWSFSDDPSTFHGMILPVLCNPHISPVNEKKKTFVGYDFDIPIHHQELPLEILLDPEVVLGELNQLNIGCQTPLALLHEFPLAGALCGWAWWVLFLRQTQLAYSAISIFLLKPHGYFNWNHPTCRLFIYSRLNRYLDGSIFSTDRDLIHVKLLWGNGWWLPKAPWLNPARRCYKHAQNKEHFACHAAQQVQFSQTYYVYKQIYIYTHMHIYIYTRIIGNIEMIEMCQQSSVLATLCLLGPVLLGWVSPGVQRI